MNRGTARARRLVGRALVAAGLAATSVIVLAGPAGAVDVATDAELRAAWTDPSTTGILLTGDIALACTGSPTRSSASPIVVDGGGHTLSNPCPQDGLFQTGTGAVTVRDLLLTGNPGSLNGIASVAPIVLERVTVTDYAGYGAASFSTVTASDSSVVGSGGPAGVAAGLGVTLTDTVVSGNAGEGVLTSIGDVAADGSTITGNGADGIEAATTVALTATTVSGNVDSGVNADSIDLVNSTVTGNGNFGTSGADQTIAYSTITSNASINVSAIDLEIFATVLDDGISCDVVNPVVSYGYNWSDTACGLTGPGDVDGATEESQLGALADNGGPTATQLPATTSPLLDTVPLADCQAGPATGVTTDQRGEDRPGAFTAGCDTGAVEVQGSEPVVPTTTTPGTPAPDATAPPSTGPDTIPRTGPTDQLPLALLGGLLVAAGLALAARRQIGRAR